MKLKKSSTIIIFLITVLLSSCHKTYTCQCTYGGSFTTTTGQVKAVSAKKAEKRCGSCSGGTLSVK